MKPAVMLFLALALAAPALAQRSDKLDIPPTLAVIGTGDARVAPDEATVRLGVTRQGNTAQEVQEEVNRAANAIIDAILKVGVSKEQIQTGQLTLYPMYSGMRVGTNDEQKIIGYRASNVVSVRLDRLNLTGPVVDAGLKAGANQLEGVSFGLRNDGPARREALKKAAAEAREKAETLAAALGLRLGPIQEVLEGGVAVSPPPILREAAFARAASGGDSTPVLPGQVTVNASVTLRYRIAER
jgi:uncharacterized protein YggE